ncbi:MAG TPA: xanthine dehydrogenase family protein subunit M [Anaerolinea sp.]|nr:xanthine dehydrogenase family protein subunit M [Anaerolinea sp.]
MKPFDYFVPDSLSEALEILQQHPGALALAGGTDLLVQAKERNRPIPALMSLRRIPGLDAVTQNGVLSIGATRTAGNVAADPRICQEYTALAVGAGLIGSVQIRNMATVGGNICNASPSADTAPGLLALGGRAVLAGAAGERTLALEDFFLGPGKTVLQPGELLVRLELPRPMERSGSFYLRHTPRAWMDLAFVGAAAAVQLGEEGEIRSVRIALGAVAPVPMRALRAEERLTGCQPDATLLAEAAQLAAAEARPIDDLRASADYRRHITAVLTRRAIEQAIANAQAGKPAA